MNAPTARTAWPWIAALVSAGTLVFSWPLLFEPALPLGGDASFAAQWGAGFTQALREGVFYPRWIADSNRGFGAPVFVFYAPLAYYGVALASLITTDVVGALRVVFIGATFLAGWTFYVAARERSLQLGAAVGAALYLLSPYRVLDLYERFALAEFVSLCWLPLVFLAVRRLAVRPTRGSWFLLVVSYAGLILTHLPTAYQTLFLLAPYALVLSALARRPRRLVPILAGLAVAVLCTAIFLLPAIVERGDVHFESLLEPWFDWRVNFLFREKVVPGLDPDLTKPLVEAAAVRQGLITLAAAALLAFGRYPGASPRRREGWLHVALATWALLLQTALSAPLWRTIPGLELIQFPWRFGALQALSSCVAVSCALDCRASWTAGADGRARAWLAALAAIGLLVAVGAALLLSAQITGARPYEFDIETAQSPLYLTRLVKEYMPRKVKNWKEFSHMPYPQPTRRAGLTGPGRVQVLRWGTHTRLLRVLTPVANRLRIETFDYPGWRARLDGQPVQTSSDNAYGAIEVEVPAGVHEIEVCFTSTMVRRAAGWASGVGCVVLIVVLVAAPRHWPLRQ